MAHIDDRMLSRELKKGSAELIILSIVEACARHGYEISKLIEAQSKGELKFHVASLYPLLYRLEERGWLKGRWVEKAGQRRKFYSLTPDGQKVLVQQRETWKKFVAASRRSWGSAMPNWTQEIGAHLANLKLEAERQAEIVEELSRHLEERYAELREQGLDDAAAVALVREELRADTPGLTERMRGAIVAVVVGQLLGAMLFGVRPFDAVTFTLVLAVLVVTAAAAVAGPAFRATHIDPVGALRSD